MSDATRSHASRLVEHADELDNIKDRAIALQLAIAGAFEGENCEDSAALARLSSDLIREIKTEREKFEAIIAEADRQ